MRATRAGSTKRKQRRDGKVPSAKGAASMGVMLHATLCDMQCMLTEGVQSTTIQCIFTRGVQSTTIQCISTRGRPERTHGTQNDVHARLSQLLQHACQAVAATAARMPGCRSYFSMNARLSQLLQHERQARARQAASRDRKAARTLLSSIRLALSTSTPQTLAAAGSTLHAAKGSVRATPETSAAKRVKGRSGPTASKQTRAVTSAVRRSWGVPVPRVSEEPAVPRVSEEPAVPRVSEEPAGQVVNPNDTRGEQLAAASGGALAPTAASGGALTPTAASSGTLTPTAASGGAPASRSAAARSTPRSTGDCSNKSAALRHTRARSDARLAAWVEFAPLTTASSAEQPPPPPAPAAWSVSKVLAAVVALTFACRTACAIVVESWLGCTDVRRTLGVAADVARERASTAEATPASVPLRPAPPPWFGMLLLQCTCLTPRLALEALPQSFDSSKALRAAAGQPSPPSTLTSSTGSTLSGARMDVSCSCHAARRWLANSASAASHGPW
eukprot:366229-Chlamydomonas_euryale.AAC.53